MTIPNGTFPLEFIDDTDSRIVYKGGWDRNDAGGYQGGYRYATGTSGRSALFNFTGAQDLASGMVRLLKGDRCDPAPSLGYKRSPG